MLKHNKWFIYWIGFFLYIVIFCGINSFYIYKIYGEGKIDSDSIITLGTPFYYELETREAYETGKVYLENSKGEFKTFYLENDGVSLQYRSVREFVSAVNDVKSKAILTHLSIALSIIVNIALYAFDKTLYDSSEISFREYKIVILIFAFLVVRSVIGEIDSLNEYVELINNADLIFESIVVPNS